MKNQKVLLRLVVQVVMDLCTMINSAIKGAIWKLARNELKSKKLVVQNITVDPDIEERNPKSSSLPMDGLFNSDQSSFEAGSDKPEGWTNRYPRFSPAVSFTSL